jgi:branched-chain amino acid transport system permease protein/urea transport system permease protein
MNERRRSYLRSGCSNGHCRLPLWVTAPRCAEPTCAAYFSSAPASGASRRRGFQDQAAARGPIAIPLPGTVKFAGTEYPIYRLLLIAISIAVVTALVVWYGRSRTGSRIRAMVSNPELAQAQGISVRWLAAGTFVTGTCLAGLGGVMIAPLVPVQPFMGLDYVLRAFFVLIVGGLGSVAGLLSGATVIGGVDSVISAATNAANGYFAVLVLAILFLWLRPRGIVARS